MISRTELLHVTQLDSHCRVDTLMPPFPTILVVTYDRVEIAWRAGSVRLSSIHDKFMASLRT